MKQHLLSTHLNLAGKRLLLLLALLMALLAAGPVVAGGWAVINLDTLPGEINAGELLHLEFTVLQHGETPVHMVYEDFAVTPTLLATNTETGETLRAVAIPAKEIGRFTLDVRFPSAGTWEWTITPDPLLGETSFAPLTVSAAPEKAAAVGEMQASDPISAPAGEPGFISSPTGSIGLGLILATAGVGLLVFAYYRIKGIKADTVPIPGSSTR